MSERTGLGPIEVALLDAVDLLTIDDDTPPVRCSDVLDVVERRHGIGHRYAWAALVDTGVPWQVHLPLVELHGNVGNQTGDPPAEARYVEVRLSAVGRMALAAERCELGPVPLGLIEGSLYRGGPVPPFAPHAVVGALLAGAADAGPPVLPTGGTVDGDLDGLLAGRPVRLDLGCRLTVQAGRVVITEVPLGVGTDEIVTMVGSRVHHHELTPDRRGVRIVRRRDVPIRDIRDETTSRDGIRLVVDVMPGVDPILALEWLRDIWPVTISVDTRLPVPMPDRLRGWDRGDGSGLRGLADLLAPPLVPPEATA